MNTNINITLRKPISQLDLKYLDLKFLTLEPNTSSHAALRKKCISPSDTTNLEKSINHNYKKSLGQTVNTSIQTTDITCLGTHRQGNDQNRSNNMKVPDILDYVTTGVNELYRRYQNQHFSSQQKYDWKGNAKKQNKNLANQNGLQEIKKYENKIRKLKKQTSLIHQEISKLYYLQDQGDKITQVDPNNPKHNGQIKIRGIKNIKILEKESVDKICKNHSDKNSKGGRDAKNISDMNKSGKNVTINKIGKDYIDEKILQMKKINDPTNQGIQCQRQYPTKNQMSNCSLHRLKEPVQRKSDSPKNSRQNSYLPSLKDLESNAQIREKSKEMNITNKNTEKRRRKQINKFNHSLSLDKNNSSAAKIFLFDLELNKQKEKYQYFYEKLYEKEQKFSAQKRKSKNQFVGKNLFGLDQSFPNQMNKTSPFKNEKKLSYVGSPRENEDNGYEDQEETLQILKKKMINNNFDKSFESFLNDRKIRLPEFLKRMR